MNPSLKLAPLFVAALMLSPLGARAETIDDMKFGDIVTMKMMDKNKDGSVSKQEFLDMMAQVWDAKARKMGVKGDRMTADQLREVAMYFKAGG